MAVRWSLSPCAVCHSPADTGQRACDHCQAITGELCASCAAKPCPTCRKGKLDQVDRVFPYSLFKAIRAEEDHAINRLLNSTDEKLDEITDQHGNTPLAAAACSDSSKAAERLCKLLMERGASADGRSEHGRTALMEMIQRRGKYYSAVANLLGSSVNAQDNSGMTALMFAARGAGLFGGRKGNMSAIRDLLEMRADLLRQDKLGLTALGHAIRDNDKGTNQAAVDHLQQQMLQQVALREFRANNTWEFDDK